MYNYVAGPSACKPGVLMVLFRVRQSFLIVPNCFFSPMFFPTPKDFGYKFNFLGNTHEDTIVGTYNKICLLILCPVLKLFQIHQPKPARRTVLRLVDLDAPTSKSKRPVPLLRDRFLPVAVHVFQQNDQQCPSFSAHWLSPTLSLPWDLRCDLGEWWHQISFYFCILCFCSID